METSPSPTPHPNIMRAFRLGPVIGDIVAGLLGLVLVVGLALSLNRRFRRKKSTKDLEADEDGGESTHLPLSTCTYIADDKGDADTLYSPNETSPALRPLRGKLSKAELELAEKETERTMEQGTLPPPFPVYKEMSL
ncbi:uncharacterized protein DFL_008110 [Arthrobotrys flagrans]|uniref:Uncharacterized protein n=1 Tax=Arthrobotrys flagrans TaxID=97331 RepID=A0A436ZMW7_ARTFL|nr:hypothetical protein DFL_008110 [Arthrobotrys flagrans]